MRWLAALLVPSLLFVGVAYTHPRTSLNSWYQHNERQQATMHVIRRQNPFLPDDAAWSTHPVSRCGRDCLDVEYQRVMASEARPFWRFVYGFGTERKPWHPPPQN